MSEKWLSIVEYARAFDVSDMTIRRRIRNGKLHAVLKDGKYYIPVASHEELDSKHAIKHIVHQSHPRQSHLEPVANVVAENSSFTARPLVVPLRQNVSRPTSPEMERNSPRSSSQSDVDKKLISQLIEYCEKAVVRLEEAEAVLKTKYEAKIQSLETKLEAKEMEVRHLAQQVEDLEVLIRFVEKKAQS